MESLRSLLRDFRYASRSLRRNPGFATAAILTLALGIGANTAIFSVLQGVVLAPLPFAKPDQLVVMALYNRALKYTTYVSYPDFLDWQRDARSFQQMAVFNPQGFDVTGPGTPEHVEGRNISSGFFGTLGVSPALGRDFSAADDRFGAAPVVIISDTLWRSRFGASPSALGRVITADGIDYTIVGILPRDFRFQNEQADLYTPIGQGDPMIRSDRTIHNVLAIARLRDGVNLSQAYAEMKTIQQHIDELNPATERGQGPFIESLKREMVGDVGRTLLLLLGAVTLVLLIACANVANLLLARSAARSREFAVRRALGAGKMQMVRQLICETALLSVLGGALGLAIAKWGVAAVLASTHGSLPRSENVAVSAPVLLFAFGVSIAVGLIFGILPARKSLTADLQEDLKEGSRGSGAVENRAQRSLVVLQVAMALMLLTGAGLLLRTVQNLWAVNPGFDTRHVISFRAGIAPSMTTTPEKTRAAYQQLVARIRQIPGVEDADITALVPLTPRSDNSGPFWIGPHQPASMAELPRALYYWVGPDYLRTLQIPLLRGRFLSAADNHNSEPVVAIDSVLARTYFGGRDPVGQTLTVAHWGPVRIIGVVGHIEHYGLHDTGRGTEKPQIYASFYQLLDRWVPAFRQNIAIAARTSVPAASVMPEIRNAVYGAENNEPVYDVHTMRELVSDAMSSQRLPMILLAAFAVLALLLAWVGIYGVLSYAMTRRVREVGIRMALGAVRRDVMLMVVGQGIRLALMGIVIGAAFAFALTRLLTAFSTLLYGVHAGDPLTFIAVSVLLITAALLACYLPARRAARLDPMAALRHE